LWQLSHETPQDTHRRCCSCEETCAGCIRRCSHHGSRASSKCTTLLESPEPNAIQPPFAFRTDLTHSNSDTNRIFLYLRRSSINNCFFRAEAWPRCQVRGSRREHQGRVSGCYGPVRRREERGSPTPALPRAVRGKRGSPTPALPRAVRGVRRGVLRCRACRMPREGRGVLRCQVYHAPRKGRGSPTPALPRAVRGVRRGVL